MAQATIIGTLGKAPELKQSRDGNTTFAKFSLAWSERQKDNNGQWNQGPTVWVQVTVFGRQAENVARTLDKGMRAVVSGRLKPEAWQSNQGDDTVMTMTADTVAPELTFASAEVQGNPKQGGGSAGGWNNANSASGGPSGGSAGDPWNSGPQGGFGGAQDQDEPPF